MIMDKFEKQKVTHLLEYSEEELNDFLNNADDFLNGEGYFMIFSENFAAGIIFEKLHC